MLNEKQSARLQTQSQLWHGKPLRDLSEIKERLLAKVEPVKDEKRKDGKLVGFKTRCPHPKHGDDGYDEHPSLIVTLTADGRLLVHCFVCGSQDESRQREIYRLFVEVMLRSNGNAGNGLNGNGSKDVARRVIYEIRERNGTLVALHERIEHADGTKTFVWRRPDGSQGLNGLSPADFPFYGIERLQPNTDVVIVEGEKCAEALWSIGVQSVATYGANTIPTPRRLKELVDVIGNGRIFLWSDNDPAGRKHMERIADALIDLGFDEVYEICWKDA
ncbi:MAG: hypothetical protein RMK89_10760, partial [Armatimonadota bacterium]|nr:hypothetical protein [Armatimonadota bacterium]MDW8143929.1 hypothetical protein [Armatimonadota bacterium]